MAQSVTITINGQNDAPVVTDELDDISRDGLTPETIDLDLHFSEPDAGDSLTYTVEAHVLGDNPGDALPADFWANVVVAGSDLNITYTDYSSEQVRLPLVITVTAHSDDGASSDETSTFTLTPVPQATLDIRLIARDVESSGRDFTSFRSEADLAAIIAGGKGGARFQLTNGLQDLTYAISGLTDYNNTNPGDGPIVDIQSDLVAVRIVDTTNSNITLFTLYHKTNSDDNPTVDFSAGTMTGVWASDDSTPFTSAILDKLYNGDLAVQVEITGLGKPKLSGKNILVSPEVDDVSNLPSSITQVVQDNFYVVEIWMSDMLAQVLASQTTETSNVSSVVLDMLWDVADASLIGYDFTTASSAFGFLAGVDNADFNGGVLENINATTVLPGLITNGYGRIGYATFLADGAADSVDFTIDTTDLISGADGVTRGGNIDFSQISITNTSVDQVAPSEFFVQTDLSNLTVSGTIDLGNGTILNLEDQGMGTGLNSTSISGRLDVVFDDINDPGTIQIVNSTIEVNPSGDARSDRENSGDFNILDLADFGLIGDQLFDVDVPLAGIRQAELSLAIRDAIAQLISSQQAIDGSGNFDITEDWLLEHGQLDSMISLPDEGNYVFQSNSEETFDQTMTFVDPVSGVPAGLTDWSHAKLTGNPTDGYVLLIPISRRVEFTTEDGYDIVLNLVGTATARFDVNQNDTDEAGDTITTAVDTELTSGAPGTRVYQGIIGNNGSLGDPNLDVDMFEVQLGIGDTVTVDVDADMFNSGLDSVLRLFDSTGTPITIGLVDGLGDPVADANGVVDDVDDVDQVPNEFIFDLGSLDSYFSFTATTAGTYYIGLSAFGQFDYDATTTGAGTGSVDPTLTGSYDLTITVENGGAPLHGTQAIVVDAPLEDGTAVDLVVVRNQTELGPNGHTLALPASDTWIDEWSSFWVEVYVETADARSITAAVADLNYNTSFFTATAIEFGSAFAATGEAVIDDATGVVTGLSGIANGDKTGYGKKALLARVKFESLAQDDVSIDFEDKFIGPHALGLSLSNVSVSLFNDTETSLVIGDAPDTDLWAIAYDVNDDDTINYRDLIILASVYGENVLDTNSPYVWALDADKSGTVNYKDLNFFVSNYGVHKGGDKDVVYPSNFLQRWYGKTTDITGDSSVDQVMDEALAIWQDALGLEEAPDIQLVITNLGGTQLGEGQITGVDSEGRPVSGIVTLDDDAAGLGWYSGLDSTVFSSSELEGGVAYTADANSDAAGHYDLLTVLLHEIGHVLGFTKTYAPFENFVQAGVGETLTFVGSGFEATLTDDGLHLDDTVHAGDVMNATLDPGVRKLPSILDALILQSAHEAAASGSFEILVGVNAPLMANLPLVAEPSVTPVTENENSLVTVIAPLDELSPVVFDVTSSLQAGDEPVQHAWNQVINNLLQSQGLDQSDLDLTVLDGLSEELSNDLRFNGLSIVAGGKIDLSDLVDLESGDLDLAGLSEEIDADFDDVFSDWAGPIL
ncbi:pre-peptidase C-terminal domain-containing protein [Gimesia maris]|uniref:pre-peptidase C-terminal domain-containing protein n=1 Tax=Gimesia maris TaxID=122 RepID=UPI00241CEED0|nr:pre-peptidase C-terminal domain-containing protein [Gimesia maris]